jgi:hypothetical protein
MPIIGKLKALNVAREKRPGLYGDGGGLYLHITKRGSKSWIFRFWIAERDAATGELVYAISAPAKSEASPAKWDSGRASP